MPGCSDPSSTAWAGTTSGWCRWPTTFFGGNIGVSGLLTGADLIEVLGGQPEGHRYLLPDACLSEGRFLDDLAVGDLPGRSRWCPPTACPSAGPSSRTAPPHRSPSPVGPSGSR